MLFRMYRTSVLRATALFSAHVIVSNIHSSGHVTACCFMLAERKSRLAEVETKWEEKKRLLTEELARVEKLLAGAYDRSET